MSSASHLQGTKPWHALITVDVIAKVLRTTILHPFVAWMIPLSLRAQATPYAHISFQVSTAYAALLTLLWMLSAINKRIAYGLPRDVDPSEEVIVITGGASGLGLLIAEVYGMRGASVAVLDVKKVEEEDSRGVKFYQCDVGDKEQVQRAARQIEEDLGVPTILINNAGIVNGKPLLELSPAEIDKNFRVNLLSHFHTIQTFLPGMLDEDCGTIVTISSVLGYLGCANLSDYTASKSALLALHASLVAELQHSPHPSAQNIRTILVTPGQLSTPMFSAVRTPSSFFGPVVEPVDIAKEIIRMVDAGESGEIAMPLYARWVQWMGILPVGLRRVARAWSGVDRAAVEGFPGRSEGGKENDANQHGLEWIQETFGLEPRWTTEPKIEVIEKLVRKHLAVDPDARCEVKFHAQGAFNKLYRIYSNNDSFLMRVSLPVDPHHKTMSEVATIEFVRQKTDMPAPKVVAFDASNENELGFEWILMEMMPGQPLRLRWRKLSMNTKHVLVKRIARYHAQLFGYKFAGIGNIFERPKEWQVSEVPLGTDAALSTEQVSPESSNSDFVLGRIVSLIFFWGNHLTQDVHRGPFVNSHDWLRARLTFVLNDQERVLRGSDDEDDIEDAENAKDSAQKLLELLPQVFPPEDTLPEPSILFHDDLSWQNMLVDGGGSLTAVIDWECVSALPLWRSCQVPAFLEGRDRDDDPRREQYSADEPEDEEGDQPLEDALDNEGVNSLYWEHLLEYEQTQLRRLYIGEMERLEPSWVEQSRKSSLKADFEKAVHNCDNGFCFKIIREWLDALDNGECWSLRKRLYE